MKKIKVHFPGVGSGEAYNINKVDKKIANLQARNDELVDLLEDTDAWLDTDDWDFEALQTRMKILIKKNRSK